MNRSEVKRFVKYRSCGYGEVLLKRMTFWRERVIWRVNWVRRVAGKAARRPHRHIVRAFCMHIYGALGNTSCPGIVQECQHQRPTRQLFNVIINHMVNRTIHKSLRLSSWPWRQQLDTFKKYLLRGTN